MKKKFANKMDIMESCRVCFQNNNVMRSIHQFDICGKMKILDKILMCSNITNKSGNNIPNQICDKCLDDLHTAYRFKINCETTEVILKSFYNEVIINDFIMPSESGEIFKYEPPQGLLVKRINQPQTTDQFQFQEKNILKSEIEFTKSSENNNEEIIQLETDQFDDDVDNYLEKNDEIEQNIISDYNEPQMLMKIEYLDRKEAQMQQIEINLEEESKQDQTLILPPKRTHLKRYDKTNKIKQCGILKNKKEENLKERFTLYIDDQKMYTDGSKIRIYIDEKKIPTDDARTPLKICDICGNTYKYKHALDSHMRRHRNEKPFSCEICGRSFVINFELRRHMRTHTGQKPYACQFCERKFSDFGSRIKHERTHTGERPYKCNTCGKAFAYSHVLSSHVLIHTGEKKYACDQCNKRFTKSHHLKTHKNTHLRPQNQPKKIFDSTVFISESCLINQTNSKNFNDVINVLTNQPKIENFASTILLDEVKLEEELCSTENIKIIYDAVNNNQ